MTGIESNYITLIKSERRKQLGIIGFIGRLRDNDRSIGCGSNKLA